MIPFHSPETGEALERKGDVLQAPSGKSYPIVKGIPRFISSDNYAAGFGLEWTIHYNTQLDSNTKTTISYDRLERCFGMPLSQLKGKLLLEAGCGSGRFTEHLVKAGAQVHSIDLSVAVEANKRNIGDKENYAVAQASLLAPPFPKESFDHVMCLGVLQHTPNPEQSIETLYGMVKPGGQLTIDHYAVTLSIMTKLAPLYRVFLKRMKPEKAKKVTDKMVDIFFPMHWATRNFRPGQMLLSRVSPCLVYFKTFPELTKEQHKEWCKLDTFDHTTDYYKHLRTVGSIRKTLEKLGAQNVKAWKGGNGVEARCIKPLK